MSRKERRKDLRVKADLMLKIDDAGSIIESRIENISCSGVYCEVKKPISSMTRVVVSLFLPYLNDEKVDFDKVECEGVIARLQPIIKRDEILYSIAIYFTDITRKNKNKIANFILKNL